MKRGTEQKSTSIAAASRWLRSTKANVLPPTWMRPSKTLRRGQLPKVVYDVSDTDAPNGTKVKIFGYNDDNQSGFDHNSLKDYVYWFTKFGSFEKELGITHTRT